MDGLVQFEGFWMKPDLARRVKFVVENMRREGYKLNINETYRPTGIPSDQWVTDAAKTSKGISTQWFQVGRMNRGETPSAIIPNADGSNLSRHVSGDAVDWDTNNIQRRLDWMRVAGLHANVSSETWHAEIAGPPQVNIPYINEATVVQKLLGGGVDMIPIREYETGAIWVFTAYSYYHEGSQQRANIVRTYAKLLAADIPEDGWITWNGTQIGWLKNIVDQNARKLK